MAESNYRIETESEIKTFIDQLNYGLDHGTAITVQVDRRVDGERNIKYTNRYTLAYLFPKENPEKALARELRKLAPSDYIRTVKDLRFQERSEMREFGKVYNTDDEIYIKIRMELLGSDFGGRTTMFVMSFHFAEKEFKEEVFPYK